MNDLNSTMPGDNGNPESCTLTDSLAAVNATQPATQCEGGVASTASPDDGWCPPGNTAPSNSHSHQIDVNFDCLEFWIFGEWIEDREEIFRELKVRKEEAKESKSYSKYLVMGYTFLVSEFGTRGGRGPHQCKFLLKNCGITIGLPDNEKLNEEPIAKVEIPGTVLCQQDLKSKLEQVEGIVKSLGIQSDRTKISRLDIKADQFNFPISRYELDKSRFITDFRKFGTEGEIDEPETLKLGTRKTGRFYLRIYNKIKELANDPTKAALFWEYVSEGELLDECTRVEFEIRREGFKHLNIDSVEDCLGNLETLVAYLTKSLFRIAAHDVDRTHTSRAKTAEYWQDVSDAMIQFAHQFPYSESTYQKEVLLDPDPHIKRLLGYLLSWIALTGQPITQTASLKLFVHQNLIPLLNDAELLKRLDEKRNRLIHELGIAPAQVQSN